LASNDFGVGRIRICIDVEDRRSRWLAEVPAAACSGASSRHSLGAHRMIALMTGALLGFAVPFARDYGILCRALRRRMGGRTGLARET
jgi:hypothetical protein